MKILFTIMLLATSCIVSAAQDSRIRVSIEEPTSLASGVDSKSGISNLRGWAVTSLGDFPIKRIALYLDGTYRFDIPYGGKRGDVCKAFDYPLCASSGYSMAFNYNNMTSGTHTFTVRAIDTFGDYNDASVTFSTTSFHRPFIGDSTTIDFLGSKVSLPRDTTNDILDKRIYLENVFVDNYCYDVILNWNTQIQGWRMEEIYELADPSHCEK